MLLIYNLSAILTVHFILGEDFNLFSFPDVQKEVSCLLSSEVTKINVIDLRKIKKQDPF